MASACASVGRFPNRAAVPGYAACHTRQSAGTAHHPTVATRDASRTDPVEPRWYGTRDFGRRAMLRGLRDHSDNLC